MGGESFVGILRMLLENHFEKCFIKKNNAGFLGQNRGAVCYICKLYISVGDIFENGSKMVFWDVLT